MPLFRLLCAVLVCIALKVAFAVGQPYDLVIRNGRVVDGTGNPAFFADVAIRDGRIATVGRVAERGRKEIDAKGLVVAPGFIDVHTHCENIATLPKAENFVRMGVTSIVTGNCGGSADSIREFFGELERKGVSINVATLVGHNTVRSAAMGGSHNRAPTPAEMAKMRQMVDRAMRDGAVGLSTGLIYLPGTFSKTPEIVELAKVASAHGGIYASHMRSESLKIFEAMNELFAVARQARIRAELSHIKLGGNNSWGQAEKVLAAIERARTEGLDVTQDQYVYTASSTSIGANLLPDWAREGGRGKYTERIADPALKAKIIAEMKETLRKRGAPDYAYAVIASYKHDRSLNGKSMPEAAKIKRGSDSLDDQIELALEIEKNGGASGVFHGINEEDLQVFLKHPNTMIASDGGVRRFGEDVPHPRSYGNNARVLGRYVRELKLLRMEDAIRRMTSLPAQTFRLERRGLLREGFWADVVLFDPQTVQDNSTYNDPHHYSTGISHVLVNGVPVLSSGEHTGAKPGRALRHRSAAR
jgi:N-acyl-D-amino-acid deacylase